MVPISERETARVLGFIQEKASHNALPDPITSVAEFLLSTFGWPKKEGKKRAKLIMLELEKSGEITCEPISGKTLTSVRLNAKLAVQPKVEEPAQPAPAPKIEKKSTPRKKFRPKRKGLAREKRMAAEKGDRNEQRLFDLVTRLGEILTNILPTRFTKSNCHRSGHHNPKKGKIDLQDKSGIDIDLQLIAKDLEGRHSVKRVILDAKSSSTTARKFNQRIRYLPGQEGVSIKKAVTVNPKISDRNIADEIVTDMILANIIPSDFRDNILSSFSEL